LSLLPKHSYSQSPEDTFLAHWGGPDRPARFLRNLLEEKIHAVPSGGEILWITYYFRDEALAKALLHASERGVKVRLAVEGNPRTVSINSRVINLLHGDDALGENLRPLSHKLFDNRFLRKCRLHEKLYFFSHPTPHTLLGTFNPSGNLPEDSAIIKTIGDQDRGHNVLLETRDSVLVEGLYAHADRVFRMTHGIWERFLPTSNRILTSGQNRVLFFPRSRKTDFDELFDGLGTGDVLRMAVSHLNDRGICRRLCELSHSGVHIEILTHDTHRRVPPWVEKLLLQSGIMFNRYTNPEGLPMHNKFMLIDAPGRQMVTVGSLNFSVRSLYANHELLLVSEDPALYQVFLKRWEEIQNEVILDKRSSSTASNGLSAPGLCPTHTSAERAPKHIVLFVKSFEGSGGAERVLLNLGCGLVAQGHRVDLVMARYSGHYLDQIPHKIKVVDLKVRSAWGSWRMIHRLGVDAWFWTKMVLGKNPHYVLGALPCLVDYLKKERPDALISSMDYPNAVAVMARKLAKVKSRVVLTVHSTLSEEIARSKKPRIKAQVEVDRRFYPQADSVITVSQGVADDLARTLNLPVESFTTIYNPVVNERLFQQAAEPLSHPWFSGDGPPVLLTVGGIKPAKDHATLLKAFALVREKRPVRLLILGEGKLRENLIRQAEELGISADLEMPGFLDNPFQYMARASLFVLSSVFEGLPTVLIEALACGCPVVSTDCPSGPREILDNGRYGALVQMADEKSLAAAILQALDARVNKDQLIARGKEFSLDRATGRYLNLIRGFDDEALS